MDNLQSTARALTFRFDTFGDETTASSRLRAFRLGRFLSHKGHRVLLNEGADCDIYVCQKVRPFSMAADFKRAGALLVYDFDDHFLLEGPEGHGFKAEVVAFINGADVVTVGSAHLLKVARNYHPNVFVLENPVDIESAHIFRQSTKELKRIGWFGTPAGLRDLRSAETAETVVTVTRRGDIEFDLATIDSTLSGFDLLLIPVETNEWNLAKNANRFVKAIALGVPILATATPEHRETAALLGLDERFLVHPGEAWDDKISALRANFAAVERSVAQARLRAIELFALDRIGSDWLSAIQRAHRGERIDPVKVDTKLPDCALLAFGFELNADDAAAEAIGACAFGSWRRVEPRADAEDFFALFDDLWDAVRDTKEEWIVLLPDGWRLARGFAVEVREAMRRQPECSALLITSQAAYQPPDVGGAYNLDLRETISRPFNPGVVAARRDWLRAQKLHPAEALSYWTWTLVVQALSERKLRVISTPVVQRSGDNRVTNLCHAYASWRLRQNASLDLPDADSQWIRLSQDVFSRLAELMPAAVAAAFATVAVRDPTIFGALASDGTTAILREHVKIKKLEVQIKEMRRSASWRVTAPLRAVGRSSWRIKNLLNPPRSIK